MKRHYFSLRRTLTGVLAVAVMLTATPLNVSVADTGILSVSDNGLQTENGSENPDPGTVNESAQDEPAALDDTKDNGSDEEMPDDPSLNGEEQQISDSIALNEEEESLDNTLLSTTTEHSGVEVFITEETKHLGTIDIDGCNNIVKDGDKYYIADMQYTAGYTEIKLKNLSKYASVNYSYIYRILEDNTKLENNSINVNFSGEKIILNNLYNANYDDPNAQNKTKGLAIAIGYGYTPLSLNNKDGKFHLTKWKDPSGGGIVYFDNFDEIRIHIGIIIYYETDPGYMIKSIEGGTLNLEESCIIIKNVQPGHVLTVTCIEDVDRNVTLDTTGVASLKYTVGNETKDWTSGQDKIMIPNGEAFSISDIACARGYTGTPTVKMAGKAIKPVNGEYKFPEIYDNTKVTIGFPPSPGVAVTAKVDGKAPSSASATVKFEGLISGKSCSKDVAATITPAASKIIDNVSYKTGDADPVTLEQTDGRYIIPADKIIDAQDTNTPIILYVTLSPRKFKLSFDTQNGDITFKEYDKATHIIGNDLGSKELEYNKKAFFTVTLSEELAKDHEISSVKMDGSVLKPKTDSYKKEGTTIKQIFYESAGIKKDSNIEVLLKAIPVKAGTFSIKDNAVNSVFMLNSNCVASTGKTENTETFSITKTASEICFFMISDPSYEPVVAIGEKAFAPVSATMDINDKKISFLYQIPAARLKGNELVITEKAAGQVDFFINCNNKTSSKITIKVYDICNSAYGDDIIFNGERENKIGRQLGRNKSYYFDIISKEDQVLTDITYTKNLSQIEAGSVQRFIYKATDTDDDKPYIKFTVEDKADPFSICKTDSDSLPGEDSYTKTKDGAVIDLDKEHLYFKLCSGEKFSRVTAAAGGKSLNNAVKLVEASSICHIIKEKLPNNCTVEVTAYANGAEYKLSLKIPKPSIDRSSIKILGIQKINTPFVRGKSSGYRIIFNQDINFDELKNLIFVSDKKYYNPSHLGEDISPVNLTNDGFTLNNKYEFSTDDKLELVISNRVTGAILGNYTITLKDPVLAVPKFEISGITDESANLIFNISDPSIILRNFGLEIKVTPKSHPENAVSEHFLIYQNTPGEISKKIELPNWPDEYDIEARYLMLKNTKPSETEPFNDDNIYLMGSTKTIKASTKNMRYETKPVLSKKNTVLTMGTNDNHTLVAQMKMSSGVTYSGIGKIEVTGPDGIKKSDEEVSAIFSWDDYNRIYYNGGVIYKDGKAGEVINWKPGKYTMKVYPQLPGGDNDTYHVKNEYIKPATLPITLNAVNNFITYKTDYIKVYKEPNKAAKVKLSAIAGNEYGYSPADKRIWWRVLEKEFGGDTGIIEAKNVSVDNNGLVTFSKDLVVSPVKDKDNNKNLFYAYARPISDVCFLKTETVCTIIELVSEPVVPLRMKIGDIFGSAAQNPAGVLSSELNGKAFYLYDENGASISLSDVNLTVSPKTGLSIADDGIVTVTKPGKYTIKAVPKYGPKNTLSQAFCVQADELDETTPYIVEIYPKYSFEDKVSSTNLLDGITETPGSTETKITNNTNKSIDLIYVYIKPNPKNDNALCKGSAVTVKFGKTAKKYNNAVDLNEGGIFLKPLKDEVKLEISTKDKKLNKTYTLSVKKNLDAESNTGTLIPEKNGYSLINNTKNDQSLQFGFEGDLSKWNPGEDEVLKMIFTPEEAAYSSTKKYNASKKICDALNDSANQNSVILDTENNVITLSYSQLGSLTKGTYNLKVSMIKEQTQQTQQTQQILKDTSSVSVKIKITDPKAPSVSLNGSKVTAYGNIGEVTTIGFKTFKNALSLSDKTGPVLYDKSALGYYGSREVDDRITSYYAVGISEDKKNITLTRKNSKIDEGIKELKGCIRYTVIGENGQEYEKTEKIILKKIEYKPLKVKFYELDLTYFNQKETSDITIIKGVTEEGNCDGGEIWLKLGDSFTSYSYIKVSAQNNIDNNTIVNPTKGDDGIYRFSEEDVKKILQKYANAIGIFIQYKN